jgi:acetoin utilization deacetylase AcuC-like enzyme
MPLRGQPSHAGANCTLSTVTLLYVTHEDCLVHDPGSGHPERPQRLRAARAGLQDSGIIARVLAAEPVSAAAVAAVHDPELHRRLVLLDERGGGMIDPDTVMSAGSRHAAELAAGSALVAVRELDAGTATRAFCAVRPPGHHATPDRSMGFCLLNSIAITAAALRDRGERVAIVDLDAHHGNGTQDAFYDDPRVLFVSLHQWPFYPGSGAIDEIGNGDARGTTINVPLPAGTTGDVYRDAIDRVVGPALARFAPTWVLLSMGFDAHRDDPLTAMGLTSGDYAVLVASLLDVVPEAKVIALLEGGYDLDAVRRGVHATLTAFAGAVELPEQPSSGGRGGDVIDAVVQVHRGVLG